MWIEISHALYIYADNTVTSFAEVWIEILIDNTLDNYDMVTSFAEVWIEINQLRLVNKIEKRHFLRGSVD